MSIFKNIFRGNKPDRPIPHKFDVCLAYDRGTTETYTVWATNEEDAILKAYDSLIADKVKDRHALNKYHEDRHRRGWNVYAATRFLPKFWDVYTVTEYHQDGTSSRNIHWVPPM